jgi:Recombinase
MLADGRPEILDRSAPVPAPAEILALMHQMRSEGETLRTIAARLNELGLKSAKGKDWHASTVRAALLAPAA